MTADERIALVRLKIERANKHISDLQDALRSFFDSNPYKICTKRNPNSRQLIYYLASVQPIPTGIPAIAGDALNSLRSALDHLAQQLYLFGSGASDYRDQTGFPISPSAKDFKPAFIAKKTHGMRDDAINAIKAIEPYKGGQGSDLWTLDRLNNIDKHRLIVPVWSMFRGIGLGHVLGKMNIPAEDAAKFRKWADAFIITESPAAPVKAGDELFIDLPEAEPDKDRKFHFQISVHEPGVLEGEPVLETLIQFRNRVDGIVEAFRPCLQ